MKLETQKQVCIWKSCRESRQEQLGRDVSIEIGARATRWFRDWLNLALSDALIVEMYERLRRDLKK